MRWTGVVLGAALALAGCGSSPDQDNASPTPPAASATAVADDAVLDRMPEAPEATASTRPPESAQAGENAFLKEVFDDAQAVWRREFEAAGIRYAPATITIFRDEIDTACGTQSASIGPFYCPADSGVYLDLSRGALQDAEQLLDMMGDLVSDHVGLGEVAKPDAGPTRERVEEAADEQDPEGANARSVRVELQADCFAGIWKHSRYHRGQLRPEDFEDALRAAAVVGSDFQQHLATGTIRPEEWTHGSSSQRRRWLTTGFEQGTPSACDTLGP